MLNDIQAIQQQLVSMNRGPTILPSLYDIKPTKKENTSENEESNLIDEKQQRKTQNALKVYSKVRTGNNFNHVSVVR